MVTAALLGEGENLACAQQALQYIRLAQPLLASVEHKLAALRARLECGRLHEALVLQRDFVRQHASRVSFTEARALRAQLLSAMCAWLHRQGQMSALLDLPLDRSECAVVVRCLFRPASSGASGAAAAATVAEAAAAAEPASLEILGLFLLRHHCVAEAHWLHRSLHGTARHRCNRVPRHLRILGGAPSESSVGVVTTVLRSGARAAPLLQSALVLACKWLPCSPGPLCCQRGRRQRHGAEGKGGGVVWFLPQLAGDHLRCDRARRIERRRSVGAVCWRLHGRLARSAGVALPGGGCAPPPWHSGSCCHRRRGEWCRWG